MYDNQWVGYSMNLVRLDELYVCTRLALALTVQRWYMSSGHSGCVMCITTFTSDSMQFFIVSLGIGARPTANISGRLGIFHLWSTIVDTTWYRDVAIFA